MTDEHLTDELARRVMRWTVGPERFTIGGRRWLPRWRFQPAKRLADAFRVLESLAPQKYATGVTEDGKFWAIVDVGGVVGEARECSQARALSVAVARAIGLENDTSLSGTNIGKMPPGINRHG